MAINFKPAEQAVLDMLMPTLPMFKQNGMSAEQVRNMYDAQLSGVEKSAKCRIDIIDDGTTFLLKTVDVGSDFIRSRRTKTALNLRAKKQNVPIVVTVVQEDKDLVLSNKEIAAGLFELAENVAAMPIEIHKANKADWSLTPGAEPKLLDGTVDGDDDDDDVADSIGTESAPVDVSLNTSAQPIDQQMGQPVAQQANQAPVANASTVQPDQSFGELPGASIMDDALPTGGVPEVDLMSN
ncbi:hypothetical protein BM525_20420 (plasmid) [Alteromonas mediterranea]|uniref:Uncharacterized protein n=1 Tax=Alteromonas mediterranea TaxID=314275 RepID=A0AAC9JEE5_9ALTE|nr:hypothetical protein [Alteromonas mediterranea]APD92245.1 hypothetical protein BM524_20225 [Alteromonas mediterranea]APE00100.1 hypothetical protein BM525_20420 [Alteromonas mediterranea]